MVLNMFTTELRNGTRIVNLIESGIIAVPKQYHSVIFHIIIHTNENILFKGWIDFIE